MLMKLMQPLLPAALSLVPFFGPVLVAAWWSRRKVRYRLVG